MTVKKLGRRMDDQIGAQVERSLQNRRAKAVIDRHQDTLRARDAHQRGDVGDFGQRIRRGFEEEHLRFRLYRRVPRGDIGLRNKGRTDAEARHDGAEQLLRGSEQARRRDHVVAAAAQRHDQRENGRHSRRRGHARLGALEGCQTILESGHRRIGEARVDVAGFLPRKACSSLRRAVEDKARCQVQGLAVLVELAAFLALAHGQRFEGIVAIECHRLQSTDIRLSCNCLDVQRSSLVKAW